jgi:hypothetical protein
VEIVDARRLMAAAPAGVEALVVHQRPAAGPTKLLCAAGDVGFSGQLVDPGAGGRGLDEVADVVGSADLAFANLETMLTPQAGDVLFAAPPAAARWLADAGFGLVNLANNHALDHGSDVFASTGQALGEAGVEILGLGASVAEARRLQVTDLGDLRVGWLSAARTREPQDAEAEAFFWEYDPQELRQAVEEAGNQVDVLVVSIHMGYMYVDYPHPGQRREALKLLTAGADLVLVHHAHVVQGIEVTAEGVVCHNLGNLFMDWTEGSLVGEETFEEQRSGGLFLIELDRLGVRRLAVVPTRVDDAWIVRWATGEPGRRILERLRRLSDSWDVDTAALFHQQLSERVGGHVLKTTLAQIRWGGPRALLEVLRKVRPLHVRMVLGWMVNRLRGWLASRIS